MKNDTHGVPPYYMMSFPIGGTPVTTLLGDDPTKLSWQPTHAPGEYSVPSRALKLNLGLLFPGTKTLLTIVDSTGSFGGVPSQLFTITGTQHTPLSFLPGFANESLSRL